MNDMTDIELYDRSIDKYLKDISNKVVFAPTDLAEYTLSKKFDVPKDKIPYPFISFYRDPNIPIDWDRYSSHVIGGDLTKLSGTLNGMRTAQYVHSIPVTLGYQVDIWGVRSTDVLELSQSLLLKLTITNPVLYVPINPDGENGRFHILEVGLVDNSDIESEESKGRIYRHTFNFSIDARIKLVNTVNTSKFSAEVHAYDEDKMYDF